MNLAPNCSNRGFPVMAVTKEARIEPSDWSGKVGVVEKVKRIRAELDRGAFGDLRLLLQGEVHVPETGTARSVVCIRIHQLVSLLWPSCNSSILQSSRNPSERVSTDDEKGGAIRRRDAMFPRWGQYRESCSAKLPSQVMKITRTVWWPVGKQTT